MNPERWQKIDALLSAALDREEEQRASFLSQACEGDEELRNQIQRLLSALKDADTFLEGAPPAAATAIAAQAQLAGQAPQDQAPVETERIGAYQLVRELGRGGMGTVYLAERVDEAYRKQVAIKVVQRGMDTEFTISRFRNERQILAGLAHPNIAALLDGGTTEKGLPYLVMEYIDGESLDSYCDAQRLPISRRLELFSAVCSAVQYSHRNLIVHRDIKPGNILVTKEGVPKLLDFGVAKILEPQTASLEQTMTQVRFLTPAFASPEQIRGEPITTASDVYSLGVVLYVLLTGRKPYRKPTGTYEEIARAICEEEPLNPSAAIGLQGKGTEVSDARGETPDKLRRHLSGDLDTIVLKALRKEPERRYTSVEQLAEDLRRHREHLPISARRSSTWYRAGKFVIRHRVGVAAAVLIVLSLAGGLFETSRQRMRAERRFNDVRQLANSFLFEFHEAIKNLPGSTKARELVVKRAQKYLEMLASEARGNRSLQAELASAYEALADIQDGTNGGLGDIAGALTSWNEALELREATAAATRDLGSACALADTLRKRAVTRIRLGDPDAFDDTRRAIGILEPLLSAHFNREAARVLAASYHSLAFEYEARREFQEALAYRNKEIELFDRVVAENPKDLQGQRNLALGYKYLGSTLDFAGQSTAAREFYRKAVSIDSDRVQAEPANSVAKLDLSFSQASLALSLVKIGDHAGALELYRQALALREEVAAADPANAWAGRAISGSHLHIAEILRASQRPAEALAAALKAAQIQEELVHANPSDAPLRDLLAEIYSEIGDCQAMLARNPSTPVRQRMDYWRSARSAFLKSEEIHARLRQEEKLVVKSGFDLERNKKGLALCDEVLARTAGRPTRAQPSMKQTP